MEYKDYYKILGVSRSADEKEIRRAFRKLANEWHPDKHIGAMKPEAEQRFKEINEAYQVLNDPEKRRKYDQIGSSWQQWQNMGGDSRGFDWSQWATGAPGGGRVHVQYGDIGDLGELFGEGDFSDFFRTVFGGMDMGRSAGGAWGTRGAATGQRARARPRQDIEEPITITLDEAFHGSRRILQLDGKRIEVDIPRGVKTGSRVRVSGASDLGDIYLRVNVQPHSHFERKGDDLYVDVDVDLYTLLLGGEVRVPTMTGHVALTIPPETQTGRSFRLSGQGMPRLRQPNQRGDLYVRVRPQLPQRLNEREQQLFRELAELRKEQV